ncbi:MAG TPA: Crp/Fnr family transcriptional regulator [Chitinophagaceae bacterium]|nr:Crp/Fnr family transcriptional regulator [Chitinophagaceae bacterium]
MHNAKAFHAYLNRFVPLSDEEFQSYVLPFITVRRYEQKQIVTRAGEVEDYLNFIVKGLVRKYYEKDGAQVNTQFSYEKHLVHSQESFHSRTPSEYTVETLEPTTFISITYDNLEEIYSKDVKMERLARKVITHTMVQRDRWQMKMIKLTPRQRFLMFIECYPNLLQRVPQKHLASFLNIQPETFSRFKHLMKERSNVKDLPPARVS